MALLKNRKRPSPLTLIAMAVLFVLAMITLGISNTATLSSRQKTVEQYKWDTEQISDRIQDTLNDYSSILYSGRAFMINSQSVEPAEWTGYFKSQDIFNRHQGMSSIAYISLVSPAQKAQFEAKMKARYGADFAINPTGQRDMYAVSSLVVSSNNTTLNGFDVYSTPDRRAVYESAQESGEPTASGQFEFANGSTGMFVTLPVARNGVTDGYVLVSLHSDDFFEATIDPSKLSIFGIKVTDVTDKDKPEELYVSNNWNDSGRKLSNTDTISFGGRTWAVEYQAPVNYNLSNVVGALPYIIMVLGFLLVCIIALFFYIFLRLPQHRQKPTTKE